MTRWRGEVQLEPRVAEQPFPHFGGLVGGVVVQDQVQVEALGTASSISLRNRMNSWCRCWRYGWAITDPLPVSNAANKLVVPLRT